MDAILGCGCDKIYCCRPKWAGYTVNIADNPLAYETTCGDLLELGPLRDRINIAITGCPGFEVDCTLVKSEAEFSEGLYVTELCEEFQCVMLFVDQSFYDTVETGSTNLDEAITVDCGSEDPDYAVLVVPRIIGFKVFPKGTLEVPGRCDSPYVFGQNGDDFVWAPPMSFDCTNPEFPIPVNVDEWKKNPCHLTLTIQKAGIPFPGWLPRIDPARCGDDQCFDPYDCVPPPGTPAAFCCVEWDHYCLHVMAVNGDAVMRTVTPDNLHYYDFGPAICRCPQCCPDVAISWFEEVPEEGQVMEGSGETKGFVFPPDLSREERRALLKEHRKTHPVKKLKDPLAAIRAANKLKKANKKPRTMRDPEGCFHFEKYLTHARGCQGKRKMKCELYGEVKASECWKCKSFTTEEPGEIAPLPPPQPDLSETPSHQTALPLSDATAEGSRSPEAASPSSA